MIISRAAGFPKVKIDTMVISVSQGHRYTQKAPKIIKLISFKGSRGILRGVYIHICVYIYVYIYIHISIYIYIYTEVMN